MPACRHEVLVPGCRAMETSNNLERKASAPPTVSRMKHVHAVCDWLCNRLGIPGGERMAKWYSNLALPTHPGVIRCPTIYGYDLMLDERTGGNVYRFGFYEAGTLHVMNRFLRTGDVFVDAGASVGLMTMFASERVGATGRVLAFEPLPRRYQQLCSSITLNGRKNVEVFNSGLGASFRKLEIYEDRVSPSMVPQAGSVSAYPTHVERLDEVLAQRGMTRVDMLKVDVEGFELEVLEGAGELLRGEDAPILCVEYGMYDDKEAKLLEFLWALPGYELFQLKGTKKRESPLVQLARGTPIRARDNVFCFPRTRMPPSS